MKLLDLFCGAGGASWGYHQSGLFDEIVGIDYVNQPRYPFGFIKEDIANIPADFVKQFDFVHASPPCHTYSGSRNYNYVNVDYSRAGGIDLIPVTKFLLQDFPGPYVIENVVGAPIRESVMLCGTMFPPLKVVRHRIFETSFPVRQPPCGCSLPKRMRPSSISYITKKPKDANDWNAKNYNHPDWYKGEFVSVGTRVGISFTPEEREKILDIHHEVMGIDYARLTILEVGESIPPAYSKYLADEYRHSLNLGMGL